MSTSNSFVALMRAVNVARRPLDMTELRAAVSEIGAENVSTYLQSGNVIFSSPLGSTDELEGLIASALLERLGIQHEVIVRTGEELERLVKAHPFQDLSSDPRTLHVTFLQGHPAGDPPPGPWRVGEDQALLSQREVFVFCPNGYGRTKLNNAYFERVLSQLATTRNWNTVHALATRVAELGPAR